jgi:single-stranded DNA-binding protein
MYNIIIVAGELVDKPQEVPYDGKPVVVFTIVDIQNRRNKAGERYTFKRQYQIEAIGSEGASCMKNLQIGDKIIAEGRPGVKTWTDKDGVAKGVIRVITDHVRFIGKDRENGIIHEEEKWDLPELPRRRFDVPNTILSAQD